jgi:hypothetical protein
MSAMGTMGTNRPVTGRPAARGARWLDPDSLDVCDWAEGTDYGAAGDELLDGGDGGDDLATPPPPQTFQAVQLQKQHRRPGVCQTSGGDVVEMDETCECETYETSDARWLTRGDRAPFGGPNGHRVR